MRKMAGKIRQMVLLCCFFAVLFGLQALAEESSSAKLWLGIDTEHVYKNMERSYSDGYVPTVKGSRVKIVVPFVAEGELKNGQIQVELMIGDGAPFTYANYSSTVKQKLYQFETKQQVCLYICELRVEDTGAVGKYPVQITASATSKSGERVTLKKKLYVTLDGTTQLEELTEAESMDISGLDELGPETVEADAEYIEEPETLEPATEQPKEPETQAPETKAPESENSDPDRNGGDEGGNSYVDNGGGGGYSGGGSSGGSTSESEKIYRQPKLTLTSQSLAGQQLQAGNSAELSASFANRSAGERIYNLKVTVAAADESLSVTPASFYYSSVGPQETITLTGTVTASPTAEAKRTSLTCTFDYENSQGTTYSETETVSVEITQSTDIAIQSFDLADSVYALETVTAGVQLVNTSRSTAYNVQVFLSGTNLSPKGTVAAGTIEAGGSYEGSVKIYVSAGDGAGYGETTGTLTLTWEDAFGETYTKTQDFTTVIKEPQLVEVEVPKEQAETNQWWAAILAVLCLLFGAILTGMGLALHRMRTRMADMRAAYRERGEKE